MLAYHPSRRAVSTSGTYPDRQPKGTMRTLVQALLGTAAMISLTAGAQNVSLEIRDITPKFIAFYDAASQPGIDEAQRWKLWQTMYGFAAVPPTPEGDKMARKMLDEAWPRYKNAMSDIRKGIGAIDPPPEITLRQVAELLGTDIPIRVRLTVAVGNFDGNAYTSPGQDGIPTVAIEVEDPHAGFLLNHEFTHAVEAEQAGLSLDWKRSIAHTIFAEGLAMRVVQKLHPGGKAEEYVGEFSPHWFERSMQKRQAILTDVAPHIGADDPETVMLYTMGNGGIGMEREAYFAGWLVVGDLLQHGWDFPRLSRVKDEQMGALVAQSLRRLQLGSFGE
jgi:hypothetical protein